MTLLFYRGTGVWSWLIRWWTRSPFAHVAPCVGGTVYDAFWASGVTRRTLTAADSRAVRVSVPSAASPAWLESRVGCRYDRWSIVIAGLTRRSPAWLHVYVSRQGEWTCSRLSCVAAGWESRAWGLRWPPTPGDVYLFALDCRRKSGAPEPTAASAVEEAP